MTGEDYAPTAPPLGEAERERLARALAADRARAAQEQAERAASAAQEQAMQQRLAQQAFSRLTRGEQILQTRCVQCHRADVVRPGMHALPGWTWVVLRMRWVHGAELPVAEAAPLVRHLAAAAAAPSRVVTLEWGVVVLMAAGLLAPISAGRIATRLRSTVDRFRRAGDG